MVEKARIQEVQKHRSFKRIVLWSLFYRRNPINMKYYFKIAKNWNLYSELQTNHKVIRFESSKNFLGILIGKYFSTYL